VSVSASWNVSFNLVTQAFGVKTLSAGRRQGGDSQIPRTVLLAAVDNIVIGNCGRI